MDGRNAIAQQELSVIRTNGPVAQDYLLEFISFVRIRTGFRPDHFRAPTELQRTLEQMERARLPMSVWQSIINGTMRLIAMSKMAVTKENFVEIFIKVVSCIAEYIIENLLLRAVLWLFCYFNVGQLSAVIIGVYYFINFASKKIWSYVAKKLEKYTIFAADNMFPNSKYQLMNN